MNENILSVKHFLITLLLICNIGNLWGRSNEELKLVQTQTEKKAALHAELMRFEGVWTDRKYCYAEPRIIYEIKINSNNNIYGTSNYTVGGRVYDQKIIGKYENGKLFLKNCYPMLDHGNEDPICPTYTNYDKNIYYIIENKKLKSMTRYRAFTDKKGNFVGDSVYQKTTDVEIRKTNHLDCPRKD